MFIPCKLENYSAHFHQSLSGCTSKYLESFEGIVCTTLRIESTTSPISVGSVHKASAPMHRRFRELKFPKTPDIRIPT